MKRILASLMLSIAVGIVALTMTDTYGQDINWQSLKLTEQQSSKIQTVRNEYVENFQALRNQDVDAKIKQQQLLQLREKMVVDVKSILTNKQQLLASEAIVDEMESRIEKRLSRVVSELVLTADQETLLKQALSKKFNDLHNSLLVFEIPDFNDRQQMFEQLDEVFPKLLSGEQLELWQQMKYKHQLHLRSLQKPERSALYLFG